MKVRHEIRRNDARDHEGWLAMEATAVIRQDAHTAQATAATSAWTSRLPLT